jgi:flagellar biosynthetic protein FlhB
MAGDKTEKATPKKREEARKKGQVGRSADLNGAVMLLAGLLALSGFAPQMFAAIKGNAHDTLVLVSSPEVVSLGSLGEILMPMAKATMLAVAPVAAVCLVAGLLANIVQVGFHPSTQAMKPQLNRLDPLKGAKNLFGPHALFETVKNIVKVAAVGAIAILSVLPQLDRLGALVGMPPAMLLTELCRLAMYVAQRAAVAYLVIAFVDYGYQRWRHEKSLRMDKNEVKDEYKQQGVPAEIKSAQKRKAMMLANQRMMDAVGTADVVVTNPTHFSVALRYDAAKPAPVVVAKGADHLAFRIRSRAKEAGVSVVPDPPLARSLYAAVDVGQMIPEELFHAVAQLLAYVYRVAGRKVAA